MSQLNTAGRVALLLGTLLALIGGPLLILTLAVAATGLGALTAILAWRTGA